MNSSNIFSVFNVPPKCFSKQTQLNKNNFDFILTSLKSSVGNPEATKCLCIDSIKSTIRLEKCWNNILDELIHSSPDFSNDSFVRFLQKSIASHHAHHVCSTKTAVCFSILLWKRIKYTIDSNSLNTKLLSEYLNIVLEKTIDLCEQDHLKSLPIINIPLDSQSQGKKLKILSRHMNNLKINSRLDLSANLEFYTELLNGISRNQKTFTALLLDLLMDHEKNNLKFSLDSLVIIPTTVNINSMNQDLQYEILDGFLLSLDDYNKETCNKVSSKMLAGNILKCLFINGSLTQDHVHLGFNKNLNFTKYNSSEKFSTANLNQWEENVKQSLVNNQIEILFIREKIEKSLKEFCRISSVLVFDNFSSSLEKKFKLFFRCPSLVYIEDVTDDHVFKIKMSKKEKEFIVLNFQDEDHLEKCFSILLKSRIQNTAHMHLEYLNHCLKRLSNILNSRQYLNGTGAEIEKSLSDSIKKISTLNSDEEKEIYLELSKDLVANAFADFYLIVNANNENDQNVKYFDDFQSKSEAWRLSFYICCIFLNSDCSITN